MAKSVEEYRHHEPTEEHPRTSTGALDRRPIPRVIMSAVMRKELFLLMLSHNAGAIGKTLRDMGLPYSWLSRNRDRDELFRQRVEEVRAAQLDLGERQLMRRVAAGKSKDIQYLLDNRGADLGYGKKQQGSREVKVGGALGLYPVGQNRPLGGGELGQNEPLRVGQNEPVRPMLYPPEPATLADWEEQVSAWEKQANRGPIAQIGESDGEEQEQGSRQAKKEQ